MLASRKDDWLYEGCTCSIPNDRKAHWRFRTRESRWSIISKKRTIMGSLFTTKMVECFPDFLWPFDLTKKIIFACFIRSRRNFQGFHKPWRHGTRFHHSFFFHFIWCPQLGSEKIEKSVLSMCCHSFRDDLIRLLNIYKLWIDIVRKIRPPGELMRKD